MLLLLLCEAEALHGVLCIEVVESPGEHPVDVGALARAEGGLPVGVVAVGLDDVMPGLDGADEAVVALPGVDDDVLAVNVAVGVAVVPYDGTLFGVQDGLLREQVKVPLHAVVVGDVVARHPLLDGCELGGPVPTCGGNLIPTDVSV